MSEAGSGAQQFDALLLVSFGGPEGPEDVLPFLENVTRGRGIPRERLAQVGAHYDLFGGVSPINAQNRALIAALEVELAEAGHDLPIYFGNRNWHPLLGDTVGQMAGDGVHRALAFVTSAYSSYSGCRQYRENIAQACEQAGNGAPSIEKLRAFWNHPGFIEANADCVAAALAEVPTQQLASTRVVFTAHSLPTSTAMTCDYAVQLEDTARLVAERAGVAAWERVYQSRSGPPTHPWLGPDVIDRLEQLHAEGITHVVLAPTGFISDHMEVIYDLDVQANQRAEELGVTLIRAATVGAAPTFVRMIRELIEERVMPGRPRRSLGELGVRPDKCPSDCCPPPQRLKRPSA
jgi:ferrochelatase